MLNLRNRILLPFVLCACYTSLSAQENSTGFETGNNQYIMRESSLSDVAESKKVIPVTAGLEVGAAIDMAGNDFSGFDIDLYGGYRSSLIKCFGLGAGYHHSFSGPQYHIPIYAIFRSGLSQKKQLFFVDFRVGYSINHLQKNINQGGFYGSAGIGINLAVSKRFGSHILLGYNFYQLSPYIDLIGTRHNESGAHLVGIRLGISL